MFTAVGLGARQLPDGVEVTVSIRRDDVEVARQTYTGASLDDARAQIATDLGTRQAAEQDSGLSGEVVGQTLATASTDTEGRVITATAGKIAAIVVAVMLIVGGARAGAQARTPAEPAGPTLTELERAKAELLQVRTAYAQLLAQHDACKAELGATFNTLGQLRAARASEQLSSEETQLKIAVESGHPGWEWNPKTGLFTAKPAPVKVDKQ